MIPAAIKRLAPLLIGLALGAVNWRAAAAPPQRADLPANPAWLLHIDCDALRKTYLGRYVLYQLDKPESYSNIIAFQSAFGFDLRSNFHGMTLYGAGPATEDYDLIVYAAFDPDRLATLLKGKGAETITRNGHIIYSWIDKIENKDDPGGVRKYAVQVDNRLIAGNTRASAFVALDVVDGVLPHLPGSGLLPETTGAGGAPFIEGMAGNLDFLESGPATMLLKLAKRANFVGAETNEQVTVVLTLIAADEMTARQMSLAAQGLIALWGLQRDNPELAKIVSNITVRQKGSVVSATLSMPSYDLIAALSASTAAKNKRKNSTR